MYYIETIKTVNTLYIALKGPLDKETAHKVTEEAIKNLRALKKRMSIVFDARELTLSEDQVEFDYFSKFLRVMAIKRPKLIVRMGGLDKFILLNKACVKINIDHTFRLITANTLEKAIALLVKKEDSLPETLLKWFKNYSFDPFGKLSENDFMLDSMVDIVGFNIEGKFEVNQPLKITVKAISRINQNIYYTFLYHPDDGRLGFDERNLIFMGDHEDVMNNQCEFSFSKAGKYIIIVRAFPEKSSAVINRVPEISLHVAIRENEIKLTKKRKDLSKKIFFSGTKVEFVFNKETLKPIILTALVYKCDFKKETMIISQPTPKIPHNFNYDDLEITTILSVTKSEKIRVGTKGEVINYIDNYVIKEDLPPHQALEIKYNLPIRKVNLRSDRATFRLPFNSNFEIKGNTLYNKQLFQLHKHFIIKDISITGTAIFIKKLVNNQKNILADIKLGESAVLELSMIDFRSEGNWVKIATIFKVVRKELSKDQLSFILGIKFLGIKKNYELSLTKFITDAQLYDKSQQRESAI